MPDPAKTDTNCFIFLFLIIQPNKNLELGRSLLDIGYFVPRRGMIMQPRATPWGMVINNFINPERVAYNLFISGG
jgi:hypothetical protein